MSVILRTVNQIIVHHSESPRDTTTLADIDAWHAANGWGVAVNGQMIHVGYHWVITGDGEAHMGRPASVIGAHAYGDNAHSIGICLTGDFEPGKPRWTEAQLRRLVQLCATYCKRTITHETSDGVLYQVKPEDILGHRDVVATACPGDLHAELPHVRQLVAAYL
jgi:hypothetical protein